MTQQGKVVRPQWLADAARALRHVFVHDLVLLASIGIHEHEKASRQRIRVSVDLAVREGDSTGLLQDDFAQVVCYEKVVVGIRNLVESGHVNLVETLAERVAGMCLVDRRVRMARVRVEKLDVFPDAGSVGVEIERFSPAP